MGRGGRKVGKGPKGDYQNKQISVWVVPFKPIMGKGVEKRGGGKGAEGGIIKKNKSVFGVFHSSQSWGGVGGRWEKGRKGDYQNQQISVWGVPLKPIRGRKKRRGKVEGKRAKD